MSSFITVVMIALAAPMSSTQVLVPKTEFRRANPDACIHKHLHGKNPLGVLPLGGMSDMDRIADPDKPMCGYTTLRSARILNVPNPPVPGDSDFDGVPDVLDPAPNDADANDDGVPDGMEDTDGDGLSDMLEVSIGTNPGMPDSDMDGTPDIIEYGLANFDEVYTHFPVAFGALNTSNLTSAQMAALMPRYRMLFGLANAFPVPIAYMEVVSEDHTGGVSDGIISDAERPHLEQHFNEWLAAGSGGLYVGYGGMNYSPTFGNPRGYGRRYQSTAFTRANQSDDLKVAIGVQYSFRNFGLVAPPTGFPDDVDDNLMVDPGRLATEIGMNGLNGLFLSHSSKARLGIENPFRGIGRQTRVIGLDVFPDRYGGGLGVDDYDDATNPVTDLDYASIYSNADDDEFILALSFYGRPADDGSVYDTRLAFDIDNDLTVELEYVLERSRLFGEKTVGRFYSNDLVGFDSDPEVEPFRLSMRYEWDAGKLGLGELYLFHGSKAALGLTSTTVPVQVFAHDAAGAQDDSMSFTWQTDRYMWDPRITTLGLYSNASGGGSGSVFVPAGLPPGALGGVEYLPGQMVAISFTGLTALTSFDLMVDETVALQATTDSGGDYSGTFTVPPGTPAGRRFLTVVDANNEFAGAILVVPEPRAGGTAGAALAALVMLGALAGRRAGPDRRAACEG